MFMPNDFGNGGGAPQGMGGPFDLQAQLAALPPQIRAQVMARMGIPGGGMQPGMPDQGMNQTGAPMPPPQGGMRPGLPGQGSQSGPMGGGGNSAIDPRTGQPWDRNIGPTARSRVLSQQPAPGSGPIQGGRAPMGPGSMTPDQSQFMQDYNGGGGGQIFGGGPSGRAGEGVPAGWDGRAVDSGFSGPIPGGGPSGRAGELMSAPGPGASGPGMPVFSDFNDRGRGGQMGGPKGPGYVGPADTGGQIFMPGDPRAPQGGDLKNPLTAGPGGGNTLTSMPAPVPNGNARPFRPQMSATDRAAAIAADKAMVGGAPPYVGKPKPMPQTDPPVGGTATDVKPLVGKPAPSPQQDPLQGATKPKPKPKPTLGRNYGPK